MNGTLKIGEERRRHGWSRKQLGELLGITDEAVRLIEIGQRKPSYEVLVKLEDLFGMGHRELFAEADDAESELPTQGGSAIGATSGSNLERSENMPRVAATAKQELPTQGGSAIGATRGEDTTVPQPRSSGQATA